MTRGPVIRVQLNEDQLNQRARHLAELRIQLEEARARRDTIASQQKARLKVIDAALEVADRKICDLAFVIHSKEDVEDAQLPLFAEDLDELLKSAEEAEAAPAEDAEEDDEGGD